MGAQFPRTTSFHLHRVFFLHKRRNSLPPAWLILRNPSGRLERIPLGQVMMLGPSGQVLFGYMLPSIAGSHPVYLISVAGKDRERYWIACTHGDALLLELVGEDGREAIRQYLRLLRSIEREQAAASERASKFLAQFSDELLAGELRKRGWAVARLAASK